MVRKLDAKTLLRVCNPLDGGHVNLELAIAKRADSYSRDGAEPFKHSKIAFRMASLSGDSLGGAKLQDCSLGAGDVGVSCSAMLIVSYSSWISNCTMAQLVGNRNIRRGFTRENAPSDRHGSCERLKLAC